MSTWQSWRLILFSPGHTILRGSSDVRAQINDPTERKSVRFPLSWAIDLRPNVTGAPQNSMARAEKYQAWGGHFVCAICCLVESNKQPLMFERVVLERREKNYQGCSWSVMLQEHPGATFLCLLLPKGVIPRMILPASYPPAAGCGIFGRGPPSRILPASYPPAAGYGFFGRGGSLGHQTGGLPVPYSAPEFRPFSLGGGGRGAPADTRLAASPGS